MNINSDFINDVCRRFVLRRASVLSAALFAFATVGLSTRTASASPRPLPFSYPYETLGKGEKELELYGDMTPLRVQRDAADPTAGRLWEPLYKLQAEFEYGIDDRWELGIYQVFNAEPETGGGNSMSFDGFKWRIRTRLAEAGEWPVDVGLYLELETMHDELALEEKILLSRRFGKLRVMANLWVEQQLERPYDTGKELQFVVNPTLGATYQITPMVHLGGEYWSRGQLVPEGDDFITRNNSAVHHYIGPAIHLNFGSLWWTGGLYAHLNDINKPQPGEEYGPIWFRTVLGVDL